MLKITVSIIIAAALASAGARAHAYDFWGVSVGSALYDGSYQLTFDGLASSNIQYQVGGYKYTRVDSQWTGPYASPAPGEGFLISRRCDAAGIFFLPDPATAQFVVITTAVQTGASAPEVGAGQRLFGPGDLKIDLADRTYGIGLRLDDLLWAVDPTTTNPEFLINRAGGGVESIYARDAGTLGDVELNPVWARVGHSALDPNSDAASAFFVSGSGVYAGSAAVTVEDTGVNLSGPRVYAYRVSVPWSVLGIDPAGAAFTASYRPDCGNDLISADFSAQLGSVPEPGSVAALSAGLVGLLLAKRRR